MLAPLVVLLAACAPQPPSPREPPVTFAEQATAAPTEAAAQGPEYLTVVDADWAQQTAQATGIPLQAVIAYAQAAAGTAVLFPTLLVVLTGGVPDGLRGTATSAVTTVAYLGFLAGPAYVGAWADSVGLAGAMIAVAGLAAVLALLAPVALRGRVASHA